MSIDNSNKGPTVDRPRLWWRLVMVGALLYVILLVSNYLSPWLSVGPLFWTTVEVLLVGFAAFAAAKDFIAFRPSRPLRGAERFALVVVSILVLSWLAAVMLTWFSPADRNGVLSLLVGLIVALPVLPLIALALPGTIAYRHIRQARGRSGS